MVTIGPGAFNNHQGVGLLEGLLQGMEALGARLGGQALDGADVAAVDLDGEEQARAHGLAVEEDGLRPLAGCEALRRLSVSNQFETADYAYLSVRLPHVDSDMLAPYLRLEHPIEDKDVMVIGKRKPFLNSERDADKLKRYEERFHKLRADFRAKGP